MNFRLSATLQLALVAALVAMTVEATATGRLTAVDFPRALEGRETIQLTCTEPAARVTALPFPEARQGVLVLKGTRLGVEKTKYEARGTHLRALALKELEGADGTPSVQVTLDLAPGVEFEVAQDGRLVAVTLSPRRNAAVGNAAENDSPVLASEGVTVASAGVPAHGHGQDAPPARSSVLEGFRFYTPEEIPRTAPRTAEEREQLLTEEIFQRRVSIDFKDAELQNVVRVLADKTNLNIILNKDQVRGTVTLRLTNVPLGSALDAILKSASLAYLVEAGGIVRIVPLSMVRTERVETRTEYIPINWVSARNLQVTLRPFLSREGKMQADIDSNGILVTDVPERVQQISRLIERIDLPEKQVMIQARLVDLTDAAQRDLGIHWQWYRNPTEVFTDPGTAEQQRTLFVNDMMSKGVPTDSVAGGNFYRSSGNTFDIFGNTFMLDYALTALEERRQATVLANPKIVTLNNLLARIEIVKKNPYISAQQTGTTSFGTIEFKDTGVVLEVTPNITNNGYVRMTLRPEQKVRKGDFQGLAASPVPIIDERLVESNVIVKDEETVVLGGLRQLDSSTSESGIPFLMRIPVLGWLFKSENSRMEKTELILFVTPHIVKDPALTSRELRQYEQIEYNWDLPDYFYDETTLREAPQATTDI